MTHRIPRWARALLLADRAVHSAVRFAALLRTEILLAGTDTDAREAINTAVFDAEDTYAPGGPAYARGLFAWERAALGRAPFPPSGRVLLGGAGGGRELSALCAMGYKVTAFEPSETLSAALADVASKHPGARAFRASYADLVRAARAMGGPLESIASEDHDAVVLGWASLSHLTSHDERLALFEALRALAPRATVLVSYLGPDDDGRANGRVEALRGPIRRALARWSGRPEAPAGQGFVPGAGFYERLTEDDLRALARAAGYTVAFHDPEPYPHALLTPGV